MKTIAARAKILYLLLAVFFLGIGFGTASFLLHGKEYVTNPRNRHLYENGVPLYGGKLLDRNDIPITWTNENGRVYNEDYTIRLSFLHTLGESGYISGGVLENYASDLIGYHFLTGIFSAKELGGNDVKLTMDANLNAAAYRAFDGRHGAAGVYNYKTGEVVCMVSLPSYDPIDKPTDIDENPDYDGVYLNKFLYGKYVPGSIFKIVTAACAIQNLPDAVSRTYFCDGSYHSADGDVICNDVHGELTLQQAFNQSCNTVFASLADELGAKKMEETAKALGVSTSFPVGYLHTAAGSYNASKADHAELGWSGIGQYTDLVSPCNMMILAGAIAADGNAVLPYTVDGVYRADGTLISDEKKIETRPLLDANTAAVLKTFMRTTVTDYYGEGYFPSMEICAKTGTAEVGEGKKPHSWIVGYSQREDFPYAFAVIAENSGSGYTGAGKIASKILGKLFDLSFQE